jgi:hypothetical protein
MKNVKFFTLGLAVFALAALFTGCQKDQNKPNDLPLETRAGVAPQPFNFVGSAEFECSQAGCGDFSYKIDDWDNKIDGPYVYNDNIISIYDNDGISFSWTSEYAVCAVIVKGGPGAFVYYYEGGSCGDEGLVAPVNPKNKKNYAISHVSFCWTEEVCEEVYDCSNETAWTEGDRYNSNQRGNWATYTEYVSGATVRLVAGQSKNAGTVTFGEIVDGFVQITIQLNAGWCFDAVAQNVKIQGYSTAPSGNPSPGGFAHKFTVTGSSWSGSVPSSAFYGVHVDVDCCE